MTTIPSLRAGLALPAITALTALALAVPATASAATSIAVAERGTATSSKASSNTETHRERGLVLECRGKSQGLRAYVQVYENSHYGNDLQVVLGGPDSGVGGGGGTEADLVRKGELTRNARVLVDGKVAKIKGTAV